MIKIKWKKGQKYQVLKFKDYGEMKEFIKELYENEKLSKENKIMSFDLVKCELSLRKVEKGK